MLEKTCTRCFAILPTTLDFFYKHPATKDGLSSRCIICVKLCSVLSQQTERGKATAERCHKRYAKTARGKAVAVQARKKFIASKHGPAAMKQWRQTYYSTVRGHLNSIFSSMKQRCKDSGHTNYKWYGGRGIKVCFRSFNEFADYVINELQIDPRELTIDRINNNGNYERGNIRFITQAENNKNKSIKF